MQEKTETAKALEELGKVIGKYLLIAFLAITILNLVIILALKAIPLPTTCPNAIAIEGCKPEPQRFDPRFLIRLTS